MSKYIPALKYNWLTPLYDPILQMTMREHVFKRALLEQAHIESGQDVLDLGCGTATLSMLLKQTHPEANVTGLDGDARVLAIAQAKIERAHLDVSLVQGMSFALPYSDVSFDRVVSSLFFHHLTGEQKDQTLTEIFRVLRPGGELHIADWGKPHDRLMRAAFVMIQLLDGFETTAEHTQDYLLQRSRNAGFQQVEKGNNHRTLFGTISLYRVQKLDKR